MDLLRATGKLIRTLRGFTKEEKLKVLGFATECVLSADEINKDNELETIDSGLDFTRTTTRG